MNVVIVNEGLLYPPTAGNWVRTLNLMLRLAERHRITYVCRGTADADAVRRAVEFLSDHGIAPVVAHHPWSPKSGATFHLRLAGNLFSPLPYAVASHNSPAVRAAAESFVRSHPVDLVQFESLGYAHSLRHLRDVPRIIIAHNVEAVIWRRMYEAESGPLRRWYVKRQWHKFARFERIVLRSATRVVAATHEDAVILRRDYGLGKVPVVENGIDREYFAQASGPREAGRVLFLGSLDWRPNQDAVELLLERIFPRVVLAMPAARLAIVGRRPPESLARRIRSLPWAELHADVPDVRPHLAHSGVMAVPLRIGSGSRLKILEAFACGLPVVSTTIGCEGLAVTAGRELLVADACEDMADAIVRCMRHPGDAAAMAQRARELAWQRYDWDHLADRMDLIWRQCAARPSAHEHDAHADRDSAHPGANLRLPQPRSGGIV